MNCEAETYSFSYSLDGKTFQKVGEMGTCYLSEEVQGGFTGCMFALYCSSAKGTAKADFEYFEYTK